MRLTQARVLGFQSFGDSGDVEFSEGINLVIGQNNAGKSALLRALLPTLPDDRHRTPEKWEQFKLSVPEIALTIDASGVEIRDWVLRSGSQGFFPIPPGQDQNVEAFMGDFFARPSLSILVRRVANGVFTAPYPSHRLFHNVSGMTQASAVARPNNGVLTFDRINQKHDNLPALLWEAWQRDMFYFAAERMTIGEAPSGYADRLQPNAGNLPNVLHRLNSERGDVFRLLVRHLREVFPTVGNLSIRTTPQHNHLEVRVWPTEAMERVELSFPLNSSGTGVSQVIALYQFSLIRTHAPNREGLWT